MLTRGDQTVEDALDIVDSVGQCGVGDIGFKDIGIAGAAMAALTRRIKALGAVSYLEVVSASPERALQSIESARALGVDKVLGGTDVESAGRILGDLSRYFPFPGRPVGHPTRLGGTPEQVAADCRRARALGCGGVDLLAYRATEADPLDLVRAARRALDGGELIVAGSVDSTARIHDLARAGADAFTVGTAAFDGSFSPGKESLRAQIIDILDACRAAPKMDG